MAKPSIAAILVALTLFVSFLVIQQDNSARAAVVGLTLSFTPGTDADLGAGPITDPSHVSSNVNVATTGRTVLVSVIEDTSAAAPVVTVKNDTSGDSITLVVAGGSPPSIAWTGSFVVKDPATSPNSPTEIQAEDGDIIQVTVGFLIASFTVDSDPPNMNEADLVPADGAIFGDGLTLVSGKVNDNGAGVAEEDITVWSGVHGSPLSQVPASLISFTELDDGTGHSFSTFINIPTDGTQDLQIQAMDGAGNALFSDSDDDTDCEVVNDPVGTLTLKAGFICEVNEFDVDTVAPILADAFTGLAFDEESTDCDPTTTPPGAACPLEENERDWIMAEFADAGSVLDGSSVDLLDFLLDGDLPKAVKWFDEDGLVINEAGDTWEIRKLVFIQLAGELNSDETPTVFLVPIAGGISDVAGNIRTSGEAQADDRIGPKFVVSNFLPTPSSTSLVGAGVQVTFTVTADEETDAKPTVTVWNVFSPGTGSDLGTTVTSAGTNKWDVVVDQVGSDTATIYNTHISGEDTSGNTADLGVENVNDTSPKSTGTFAAAGGTEVACTAADPCIIDHGTNTTDVIDGVDCSAGFDPACVIPDDGLVDGFFDDEVAEEGISSDAIFFEGDTPDLALPVTVPAQGEEFDFSGAPFVILDFGAEGDEYPEDSHELVTLIFAELDGVDVLPTASTEDGQTWLIPVTGLGIGPHTLVINAMDEAGNELAGAAFMLQFTVTNLPPVVEAGPDQTADEGSTLDLAVATFTDTIDVDTHTATIDWGDGTIEAGTVVEAGGSGTVSGSHIYQDDDGGPFTVTVTVTDNSNVSDSDSFVVTVANVDPVLEAGNDQAVNAGETMSLDPATFTDAGAADTHSAVVEWGDGTHDIGVVDQDNETITQSHVYASDGVFPVTIVLIDDDGGFDVDGFTATVGPGEGPEVDLSITKADSPDPVLVSETLTYSLEVTNNASSTATGVEVTDTLATSTAFVSASAGCTYDAGTHTVTCDIGSLGIGAIASSTIVVMPTAVGVITNTAEVTGNEPDPNPANNTATAITTVDPAPATADLSVTKADSPDPVFVGDTLTYRLIVSNHAHLYQHQHGHRGELDR